LAKVTWPAHEVKGAVKETVGKVTGDAKTQAEGATEKAAGKVQNAVGGAKDTVRDAQLWPSRPPMKSRRSWFAVDSPLEGDGFEPSVPP
jgi:uncharacterized protein YjbJ (UPF0337 family)